MISRMRFKIVPLSRVPGNEGELGKRRASKGVCRRFHDVGKTVASEQLKDEREK